MPAKLLVVCGPTASGKTKLAVELALRHGGEVVSADSMQVYRGMDLGTAKPTQEEMRGVPHHMLDVADPTEDYSVARYVEEASACVDGILARGALPILAGGTGLYIDALLAGIDFAAFTGGYREKLQERARTEGIGALYAELQKIDPHRAEKLHLNDEKRILRALEVWYETGETITAHDARTQALPPRYDHLTLALNCSRRADLWARIDARVDEMMAAGLEGEVRGLLARGVPRSATAMQAIGYKELVSALDEGRSVAQAAEEVKLRSRQYAKRQLSWFRRSGDAKWIVWKETPDFESAIQNSTTYMEEYGLL
ncbi:MAG TPA: tRNA (adenosine(37)-N6)-dimethylallyltransferase MiaA [Pseudoflavonifractor sp.]|nr:tRNA (adenosine(37)-N6)-dimethylallyltransferase MiaA [Pseudoflavonifractor sp.]